MPEMTRYDHGVPFWVDIPGTGRFSVLSQAS